MRLSHVFPRALLLPFGGALFACSTLALDPSHEPEGATQPLPQAESWNDSNDPTRLDPEFEVRVNALPLEGKLDRLPIPAPYWATSSDSINSRWDGDNPSPSEKYGQAFGAGADSVSLAVSETHGLRSRMKGPHARTACKTNDDCSQLTDGSICGIPRGETNGVCIPTWWGICHGWAPYAITEPMPIHPVTRGGVTFYPGDIVGLMSLLYAEKLPTAFLSQRCNALRDHVTADAVGRLEADACRDLNPGSLHVLVANRIGRQKKGFVYDRSNFAEVWNQPAFAYRVTNGERGKLKEISRKDAIALLGRDVSYRTERANVVINPGEPAKGSVVADQNGILAFRIHSRGDASLHVKKGAEATENGADCTFNSSFDAKDCRIEVRKGDVVHYLATTYFGSPTFDILVGTLVRPGQPSTLPIPFSEKTHRLYYVEMDLDYGTEGLATRDAPTPERNVLTDHLTYLLEVDIRGQILGGEWVGDSLQTHPDFAWWPTGSPKTAAKGSISYEVVKSLNDEASRPLEGAASQAVEAPATPGSATQPPRSPMAPPRIFEPGDPFVPPPASSASSDGGTTP